MEKVSIISINGAEIEYEVRGSGDPLLLIHGAATTFHIVSNNGQLGGGEIFSGWISVGSNATICVTCFRVLPCSANASLTFDILSYGL